MKQNCQIQIQQAKFSVIKRQNLIPDTSRKGIEKSEELNFDFSLH